MKSLDTLIKENTKETVKGYFEGGKTMFQRVIGLEVANSSIKAYTFSDKTLKPRDIYESNTIREVAYSDVEALFTESKIYYTYNKKTWDCGSQGGMGTGGKERDYGSEEFVAQVVITIAKLLEYETEEIFLVYGLPATSIDNMAIIGQLNKLKCKHEIIENKKKRTFEIAQVKCLAQPVGTLFSMAFDINGNPKGILNHSMDYMIFDLGFQTLDIVKVSLSTGITKRDTYPYGMSNYNSLLRDLISKKDPSVRSLYPHIYKFDDHIRKGFVNYRGGQFSLKDVQKEIDSVQTEFAREMLQTVKDDGWDFGSFNKIILTGGGCMVLYDAIKKEFPKNYSSDIILVDDPVMANAIGFYIFGRKFFKI